MTHAELTLILRKLEEIRALLALLVEAQNKSGGILSPMLIRLTPTGARS